MSSLENCKLTCVLHHNSPLRWGALCLDILSVAMHDLAHESMESGVVSTGQGKADAHLHQHWQAGDGKEDLHRHCLHRRARIDVSGSGLPVWTLTHVCGQAHGPRCLGCDVHRFGHTSHTTLKLHRDAGLRAEC
jgi:hypothetical protein